MYSKLLKSIIWEVSIQANKKRYIDDGADNHRFIDHNVLPIAAPTQQKALKA